jgi:hypothetical protein
MAKNTLLTMAELLEHLEAGCPTELLIGQNSL